PNPRRAVLQGWLHPNRSPGFTASRLSYATRAETQHQAAVKVPGSFRPSAGNEHLYSSCNFAGSLVETVAKSLRHSCRSELTRQGISLDLLLVDRSVGVFLNGGRRFRSLPISLQGPDHLIFSALLQRGS